MSHPASGASQQIPAMGSTSLYPDVTQSFSLMSIGNSSHRADIAEGKRVSYSLSSVQIVIYMKILQTLSILTGKTLTHSPSYTQKSLQGQHWLHIELV